MRRIGFVLVFVLKLHAAVHAQDVAFLIAESDPTIQEQINRIYNVFRKAARDDLKTNCEAFDELQRLKDMTDNKGEIVKQLAIFTATTESEENTHVLLTGLMLNLLDLPASIPIRVLAPYVDSENKQLRDFAHGWFYYHDSRRRIHGLPPLGSVNYYDYMHYVSSRFNRGEEIPTAFVEYVYEKHPGKALLVFAYGLRVVDFNITPPQRQSALRARSEIELSEHIISNAIWLKENKFPERFQRSLPEASAELAKLAKHDQWWARLYVAEIMRRHRELRQVDVIETLSTDSDPLVAKTAKAGGK